MARMNNNFIHKHAYSHKGKLDSTIEATKKCRFVFSGPETYHNEIVVKDRGDEFLKNIIWKLYGPRDKRKVGAYMRELYKGYIYLFGANRGNVIADYGVDKRYLVSGWKYPLKITQIGCIIVFLLFGYALYGFVVYSSNTSYANIFKEWAPLMLVVGAFSRWAVKYVVDLKELMYGKHSIESYFWNFFIYWVQLLNARHYIPVYYSRSFLRYFKSDCIIDYLNETSDEVILDAVCKKIKQDQNDIPRPVNMNDRWMKKTTKQITEYRSKMKLYKEISQWERLYIHDQIVSKYKAHKNRPTSARLTIQNRGDLSSKSSNCDGRRSK